MSFQPVIPMSGLAGWSFLERTRDKQQEAFNNSGEVARNADYFREKINSVTSAQDLMDDRRLLSVALGAFGLDDDIDSKYFVQKVLEDGTLDATDLSNKLSDKRYYEFAKAFGFGDFATPNTVLSTFADEIITSYQNRQFEIAIGEVDENMRLASNLDRDLSAIAAKSTSENGKWYSVLGNTAVREVFETALNLPSSIGSIDLDQQVKEFRQRAESMFGDDGISQFTDPEKRTALVQRFLLMTEVNSTANSYSPAQAALTLLSGG
ncbi:hypothetical protein AQS8620_00188 [Aquimixticola soesokkakensis]|uniref:Flagellar protein n=1 Tax=Aquimixticola soesokkakensis TaxID=1519096 RepID=A0A1Y5RBN8_9RHOB|nr:DUF1217 domain-containing protein [Aquimixticola soesokkakensis]SLN13707.1 hypothetical protein AQS8620_00188 [Aquimixticola soesokkakensis]